MRFDLFATFVESAGLRAHQCSSRHFQIHGGLRIVNCYTTTKRGMTFYVQGMAAGRPGDIHQAIKAANDPVSQSCKHAKRKKNYRGIKNVLLRSNPKCYWCKSPLNEDSATLDHVIPLSRGGSNGQDNVVLACNGCNRDRRNNVTAEELEATR